MKQRQITALKGKHAQQMSDLRQFHQEKTDQLKQEHREEVKRIRKEYREDSQKNMVQNGIGCGWESKCFDETQALIQRRKDFYITSASIHKADDVIA